jgi:hypothetical protein
MYLHSETSDLAKEILRRWRVLRHCCAWNN